MTHSATRPAQSGRASGDRANLYNEITGKIIAELEAGRLPWVQPWGTSGVAAPIALPKNAATGRRYSGINVLILWGDLALELREAEEDVQRETTHAGRRIE